MKLVILFNNKKEIKEILTLNNIRRGDTSDYIYTIFETDEVFTGVGQILKDYDNNVILNVGGVERPTENVNTFVLSQSDVGNIDLKYLQVEKVYQTGTALNPTGYQVRKIALTNFDFSSLSQTIPTNCELSTICYTGDEDDESETASNVYFPVLSSGIKMLTTINPSEYEVLKALINSLADDQTKQDKFSEVVGTYGDGNTLLLKTLNNLLHLKGSKGVVVEAVDNTLVLKTTDGVNDLAKITMDEDGIITFVANHVKAFYPTQSNDVATKGYVDSKSGVTSVNSKTGVVVLNTNDIKANNSATIQSNLERIDGLIDVINEVIPENASSSNQLVEQSTFDALEDRVDNLSTIGRYLSDWDCVTGLPTTEPPTELPYEYKTGDYYIVSNVGEANFKPNGSEYDGEASTTYEFLEVEENNIYKYDGTTWSLIRTNIDLTYYVKAYNSLGVNNIVLGDGDKNIKTTGIIISESITSLAQHNEVPTCKAVKNYVDTPINNLQNGKENKIISESISTTTYNDSITSEKDYNFTNPLTSLTITSLEVAQGTSSPFWFLSFTAGANLTVTFMPTLVYANGEPTYEEGNHYILCIKRVGTTNVCVVTEY